MCRRRTSFLSVRVEEGRIFTKNWRIRNSQPKDRTITRYPTQPPVLRLTPLKTIKKKRQLEAPPPKKKKLWRYKKEQRVFSATKKTSLSFVCLFYNLSQLTFLPFHLAFFIHELLITLRFDYQQMGTLLIITAPAPATPSPKQRGRIMAFMHHAFLFSPSFLSWFWLLLGRTSTITKETLMNFSFVSVFFLPSFFLVGIFCSGGVELF